MSSPLNVLCYSDSPTAPTGFSTVVRNVFGHMLNRCIVPMDVNFYGVNYDGHPHGTPFRIWPAQVAQNMGDRDLHGRARLAALLLSNQWPLDVLFLLLDHFTLTTPVPFPDGRIEPFAPGLIRRLREQCEQGRPPFRVVQYIPVDCETMRPEWAEWIDPYVDYPVAYTHFGRRVLLDLEPNIEAKLNVIPHGTNPELFFPLPAEQRRAWRAQAPFSLGDDDPLIVNVNRNQPRKDVPRTLQVFEQVRRKFPTAKLYLHMNIHDSAGFDLERVRLALRIPSGVVIYPANFSEGAGVPVEALNQVYNAADVVLTTTRGEGWGLSVTESMCAGRPCVATAHTSHTEILGEDRGVLVPPSKLGEVMIMDNDQFRPVTDVDVTADAVCALLADRERREAIGRRAREWALGMTWADHIVPMWETVFRAAAVSLGKGASAQRGPMALNAEGMSL